MAGGEKLSSPKFDIVFLLSQGIGLIVSFLVYDYRVRERDQVYERAVRAEMDIVQHTRLRDSEGEAMRLATQTANLLGTYRRSIGSLPTHLEKAHRYLQTAQHEYTDRAYAPFWDQIERAARELATFASSVKLIGSSADGYREALCGRLHNFPALAEGSSEIPNPESAISELNRLVRLAQRDFEFSTIWEHRRTRAVLIEGFATLGDAINNVGATVRSSLHDLKTSLSVGLEEMVSEQRQMRNDFEVAVRRWETLTGKRIGETGR